MSDLVKDLRNYAAWGAEKHLVSRAADLIESQRQRIAELEHREAELATHVERLRDGLNDAIEALVAKTSESGSVEDAEIHDLRTLELSTPTTSLNALRREAFKNGFIDCADEYGLEHTYSSKQGVIRKADEYTNQRYPDKE